MLIDLGLRVRGLMQALEWCGGGGSNPSVASTLVKRLRRNPYLRRVCGYGDRAPCEAHFTQMKKRIGAEGFRTIEAWLRGEALRIRFSARALKTRINEKYALELAQKQNEYGSAFDKMKKDANGYVCYF